MNSNREINSIRITKYNPQNRDRHGLYTLVEEWISISDVGSFFEGEMLTMEQYVAVESKYVQAVEVLMQESGVNNIKVMWLGNYSHEKELDLSEGKIIPRKLVKQLIRMILREKVWARIVAKNQFEVHFGYDYYMYFVGEALTNEVIKKLQEINGLYVEDKYSPLLESL